MIYGDKVMLRPPVEADMQFLYRLRNDIDLQLTLLSRPRANSQARVAAWVEKRMSEETSLFFLIAEKESESACGFIQLTNIDPVNGTGSLGICVDRDHMGGGYAHEALSLFEGYVSSVFNLRKVTLEVLSGNERAIAFYRKEGFSVAGVWTQHVYQAGEFHDVTLMEKLLNR